MGSDSFRLDRLLLSVVILGAAIGTPVATAHEFTTAQEKYDVFFSDDPDQRSEKFLDKYREVQYESASQELMISGKVGDFYFDTTNPRDRINGKTLHAFREDELHSLSTSRRVSRLPSYSALPERLGRGDLEVGTPNVRNRNRYVKDAYVTILGTDSGVRPIFGRTSWKPLQPLYIPAAGEAYTYTDFRVERDNLPENYCTPIDWDYVDETYTVEVTRYDEDGTPYTVVETRTRRKKVDGDRWCFSYRLDGLYVLRTLRIGSQDFGNTRGYDAGPEAIPYWDARAEDVVRMAIIVEVGIAEVETMRHLDWDHGDGWEVERIREREKWYSETVRDRMKVLITTNQDLSVSQIVVDVDGSDQNVVYVDIDGPTNHMKDRRFWARMWMGDQSDRTEQYISNIWGVYSLRQYVYWVERRSGTDERRLHHPPQVTALHLAPRDFEPRIIAGGPGTRVRADIVDYESIPGTKDAPPLEKNVNLTIANVELPNRIVIANAPSAITRVEDIHGNLIPITRSKTIRGRVPYVQLIDRDHELVVIRVLTDKGGRPLSNRGVFVSGAEESYVVTDSEGEAIVHRAGPVLTVETEADEFDLDADEFWVSATVRKEYIITPGLVESFVDFMFKTVLASPFILVWILFRSLNRTRERENQKGT